LMLAGSCSPAGFDDILLGTLLLFEFELIVSVTRKDQYSYTITHSMPEIAAANNEIHR